MEKKFNCACFLDVDGVLNHQLFYEEQFSSKFDWTENIPIYKQVKKWLRKRAKSKEINWDEYYKSQLCSKTIGLINEMCEELNMGVVISSSWRNGKTVEELQRILGNSGATFTIIGKTDYTGYERGTEISKWIDNNSERMFGIMPYDFRDFCIVDDDDDFLIEQAPHFFQTDPYAGFTPTTWQKISRFITKKTFYN